MTRVLVALILIFTAPSVCFAEYVLVDDLSHCKWRDGRKISKRQCDDLNDKIFDVRDRIEEIQEELAKPNIPDWQRKLAEQGGRELIQYSRDLMERSFKISQGKPGRGEELRDVAGRPMWSLPMDPDAMTDEEKEQLALKRKCGKDYGAIRVGMSIKRLEECTGVVFLTQTVGKNGVIDTYRTSFDWVNVQNGRVISYTERTDN